MSHARQNNSSTIGTIVTARTVLQNRTHPLLSSPGLREEWSLPVMLFEKAGASRYAGISKSGAIQSANTRIPTAMLAQGRTGRKESSRGQAQKQMTARARTHTGGSQ